MVGWRCSIADGRMSSSSPQVTACRRGKSYFWIVRPHIRESEPSTEPSMCTPILSVFVRHPAAPDTKGAYWDKREERRNQCAGIFDAFESENMERIRQALRSRGDGL